MPADQRVQVFLGRQGINLRDQPAIVGVGGLVSSVNWRLDERGALVKRLGYESLKTGGGTVNPLTAAGTELAIYQKTGATVKLVAAAANGRVQTSPENGVWTDAGALLPSGARPSLAQLGEKVYIGNGADQLRSWDGSAQASIAAAPVGRFLATWRNRLWVTGDGSHPNRVYWSNILDPTTWQATNFVDLDTHGEPITAITAAPNIGTSFDGSDGVLVFTAHRTFRIYDDSDNTGGVESGGSNVLVDGSQGCIAQRSIAHAAGRVFLVGEQGILSTDGHSQLRLESALLGVGFFTQSVSQSARENMAAVVWDGHYLLAFPRIGSSVNTHVIELSMTLGRGQDGYPIMVHDIPASAWAIYPSSSGPHLYFIDSSPGDETYVRRCFVTGTDVDDAATLKPIYAEARSGADAFGWPRRKKARQITARGRGDPITIGVIPDLSYSVGETRSFRLPVSDDTWNDGERWNEGTWGPTGGTNESTEWYESDGRMFSLLVSSSSSTTSSPRARLGITPSPVGGAALYELLFRYTPLNSD